MRSLPSHIAGIGLALIGLASLSGCELFNPAEETPAFIYIEDIELRSTNPGQHGSITENITDAWVFIDNDIIGTYELPARVPILETGSHNLKIFPGIKKNGIASTRAVYPMFTWYENDTSFQLYRDSTLHIDPWVSYRESNTYVWKEDFEDVGISLEDVGMVDVIRLNNSFGEPEFGDRVARYNLNRPDTTFRAFTDLYELPRGLNEIYLELDYNCSNSFFISMRSYNVEGIMYKELPLIEVRNTNNAWRKMYVELTQLVTQEASAVEHQFAFYSVLRPAEQSDYFMFDNLKLVQQ